MRVNRKTTEAQPEANRRTLLCKTGWLRSPGRSAPLHFQGAAAKLAAEFARAWRSAERTSFFASSFFYHALANILSNFQDVSQHSLVNLNIVISMPLLPKFLRSRRNSRGSFNFDRRWKVRSWLCQGRLFQQILLLGHLSRSRRVAQL